MQAQHTAQYTRTEAEWAAALGYQYTGEIPKAKWSQLYDRCEDAADRLQALGRTDDAHLVRDRWASWQESLRVV